MGKRKKVKANYIMASFVSCQEATLKIQASIDEKNWTELDPGNVFLTYEEGQKAVLIGVRRPKKKFCRWFRNLWKKIVKQE